MPFPDSPLTLSWYFMQRFVEKSNVERILSQAFKKNRIRNFQAMGMVDSNVQLLTAHKAECLWRNHI